MKDDARYIRKFIKVPKRTEITIHLDDGTMKTEGYMMHKPKAVPRGDLAEQLGLKLTSQDTRILPVRLVSN